MTPFRADLHCHTTCSDGTFTPEDLVKLACQQGLNGLSITDHDTIEAYQTAVSIAETHQLPLVSGVEFSTSHLSTNVHILAYSFSTHSPIIQEFCKKHMRRRIQRNRQILALLTSYGMPIDEGDIQGDTYTPSHTIGRPHIALAMVKKRYVSSIQEAFNKYIGENKPCYAPGGYFTPEETIDLIHQAKGLAVIAHPHLMDNEKVMQDLLSMNFDGIEGYYARFPADQQEKWVKIGEQKGWLVTGGSDFHGDIKPNSFLGSSWVSEETFKVLYNHFMVNQTA